MRNALAQPTAQAPERALARLVPVLSTFFLAALFLYAGFDKVFHYDGFVSALGSYSMVPTALAGTLAPAVIAVEILIGAALFYRPWRRLAALLGAALLVVFTGLLIFNQIYAPGTICGCWFSVTLAESNGAHVALNLVFAALAVTVWADERQRNAN